MTVPIPALYVFGARVFDVELIGVNARTGRKLLFTLALIALVLAVRWIGRRLIAASGADRAEAAGFWTRQGLQLLLAIVTGLGLASIWINPGTDITTGLGLISAGLAFALQQVITALAGYFVILRGDTFNVGDRIALGKVRGDVIRLGFIKTTVMEMGQPASVSDSDPSVWISGRQYTGRLVTVSNGRIFDEPVFNYTRDFPYVWEEMAIPIGYTADRDRAEQILLDVAREALSPASMRTDALRAMRDEYAVLDADIEPAVYLRITDNWLELSMRFVLEARSARRVKSEMSREILRRFDEDEIEIASATYEIVGLPAVTMQNLLDDAEAEADPG